MPMPHVMQIDRLRARLVPLRNWDQPVRLYHDETNNIRRLTLGELGLNAPDNRTFAIAGVALQPGREIDGWPQLRRLLQVQPSAPEIKFEHLAKGRYEDALASRKLASFLQWLLDQDIMIHYSAMDPVYWSILDIVESLQADGRLPIHAFHGELKSELHHAAIQDLPGFMALLHGFHYPDVPRDQVPPFLEAVLAFVHGHVPQDRSAATWLLRQALRQAVRLPSLALSFLHDNEPGALIDDFSGRFLHRIYVFKNASHVFDRETFVERVLAPLELREGARRLDYRFADSKAEVGVQLSDVVAGLIGRHFSYLRDHSLSELMRRRDGFTEVQRGSLARLRALIDRSDAFSEGLFHMLLPLDTVFKNNAFLHEQEVPPFMWQ